MTGQLRPVYTERQHQNCDYADAADVFGLQTIFEVNHLVY